MVFRCDHAFLKEVVSVCQSVSPSVGLFVRLSARFKKTNINSFFFKNFLKEKPAKKPGFLQAVFIALPSLLNAHKVTYE